MVGEETEASVGGPVGTDKDAQRAGPSGGLGRAAELPLLRAAWEASPDAVLFVRAMTLQVVLANPAAGQLLGYSPEALGDMPLARIAPDSPSLWAPAPRGPCAEGRQPVAATRVSFRTGTGALVPVECRVLAVATPADTYLMLMAHAADESGGLRDEGRGTRDEGRGIGEEGVGAGGSGFGVQGSGAGEGLASASSPIPNPKSQIPNPRSLVPRPSPDDRDALTGLPDRRQFEGRLLGALRKARSRPDYHFAVLFIDLDGFKVVNDTWGHLHGDRVLHDIAARLHACVRPEDMVARFGGDEFTVLVDHLSSPSDVVRVAQRIQSRLADPVEIEGRRLAVTASIGIALSWHGYRDPETMLHDADRAMYRAKAEGKARYCVWAP